MPREDDPVEALAAQLSWKDDQLNAEDEIEWAARTHEDKHFYRELVFWILKDEEIVRKALTWLANDYTVGDRSYVTEKMNVTDHYREI